jgi:flagellar hook-associated protein 2
MGITMNDDGTLTVDSSTLSDAVTNNYSAVQKFFQGSDSNGFANSLDTQLSSFTDPSDGAFTVELTSLGNQYTTLTNQINDFENNYIASQKTILTAEYSQAEIGLQQIATTQKQIDALLGNNSSSGN